MDDSDESDLEAESQQHRDGDVQAESQHRDGDVQAESQHRDGDVQAESQHGDGDVQAESQHRDGDVQAESQHRDGDVQAESQHRDGDVQAESQHRDGDVQAESQHRDGDVQAESQHRDGDVQAESQHGDGDVQAESQHGDGDVQAESQHGDGDVQAESQHGDGDVQAESQHGDGDVEAESQHGDGDVEAESQHGDVDVQAESQHGDVDVQAESQHGDVDVQAESQHGDGDVQAESQHGDVDVQAGSQHGDGDVQAESQHGDGDVQAESQHGDGDVQAESQQHREDLDDSDESDLEAESQQHRDGDVEAESQHGDGDVEAESQHGDGDVEAESQHRDGDVEAESQHGDGDVEAESQHGDGDVEAESQHGHGDVEAESQHGDGDVEAESQNGNSVVEAESQHEDGDAEDDEVIESSGSEYRPPSGSEDLDDSEDESDLEAESQQHRDGDVEAESQNGDGDVEAESQQHRYGDVEAESQQHRDGDVEAESQQHRDGDVEAESQHGDRDVEAESQHGDGDVEAGSQKYGDGIEVVTTGNQCSRTWDKVFVCYYCEKPQKKISRHLQVMHKDEPEVIKVLLADKKERDILLCKLRNLGNHKHNCQVLRKGKGKLLVSYRPSEKSSPHDYIPCEHCLGYFAKSSLWKHQCPVTAKTTRDNKVQKGRLLLPAPPGVKEFLKPLLSNMRQDQVYLILRNDDLIMQLAERFFLRLGHEKEQHSYIRGKLREMGRFLVELRKLTDSPNANLQSFIDPAKFKFLVQAARQVAQFDKSTNLYGTPSLALKIGHTLKKCTKISKAKALETSDKALLDKADCLEKLCDLEWTDKVSSNALRTLYDRKRNNPKVLPLSRDIVKLSKYLDTKGQAATQVLKDEAHEDRSEADKVAAWKELSEVTLSKLILFNRKRQGEPSKMKLAFYKPIKHADVDAELGLSEMEKQLCQILARVEVPGKRGRTVPMLLTQQMQNWISILISSRDNVGISKENPYMFARLHRGFGYIRGSDCLRTHAVDCGAEHPEYIRSTRLRKHIATMSQIVNLKENELDTLANFMGHDLRVHREYYRMPQETLQIAKLSKLLLTLERGNMAKVAGKGLDDINIGEEGTIF